MKTNEQIAAQRLYFQTGLNNSAIAKNVGISRSTLHEWIVQHNWETLKRNAEFMPVFLVQNLYQILGNLTKHLLSEERVDKPVTLQEVNAMNKLMLTINKLTRRAALNESMQTLAQFTDHLATKDPALTEQLQPHIEEFVTGKAAVDPKEFRPVQMNDEGFIPQPGPATRWLENEFDKDDVIRWAAEEKLKTAQSPATAAA